MWFSIEEMFCCEELGFSLGIFDIGCSSKSLNARSRSGCILRKHLFGGAILRCRGGFTTLLIKPAFRLLGFIFVVVMYGCAQQPGHGLDPVPCGSSRL